MTNAVWKAFNSAMTSLVRRLTVVLACLLPEEFRGDISGHKNRLEAEDCPPVMRALTLLLIIVLDYWPPTLYRWIFNLPYVLNPQSATAQISLMYGPDVVERVEQEFLDDHLKLMQPTMRLLSPFLLVITLISGILDIWCLPDTWPIAWFIRLIVCLALAVTTLLNYRFKDIYRQFHQLIQSIAILACGLGQIWIMAQSHTTEPGHSAYMASLMLYVLMAATLSGLRTDGVFLTCSLLIMGHGTAVISKSWLGDVQNAHSTLNLVSDIAFLVTSSSLAISATLWQEQSLRISFMIRYVLLHTYGQFVRAFGGNDAAQLQVAVSRLQHKPKALQSFLRTSYPEGASLFLSSPAPPQLPRSAFPMLPAAKTEQESGQHDVQDSIPENLQRLTLLEKIFQELFGKALIAVRARLGKAYKRARKWFLTEEAYVDLDFMPSIRSFFKEDYFYASLTTIRGSIALAVGSYMGFAAVDWFSLPETRQFSLTLRMFFLVLGVVTALSALQERLFSKGFPWLIGVCTLYAGISVALMATLSNPGELGFATYHLGLFNVLVYTFVFSQLRFPIALFIAGVIFVSYVISALSLQKIYMVDAGLALFANNCIFLLGSCLAGGIALKLRENYTCDEFFVRYLLLEKNKEILAFQEEKGMTPQQLWERFTELRHSPQKLKALLKTILQSNSR